MRKKVDNTLGVDDVQVFELTMDNPEDQDELNRRLRKPGEATYCSPAKFTGNSPPSGAQGESAENK